GQPRNRKRVSRGGSEEGALTVRRKRTCLQRWKLLQSYFWLSTQATSSFASASLTAGRPPPGMGALPQWPTPPLLTFWARGTSTFATPLYLVAIALKEGALSPSLSSE